MMRVVRLRADAAGTSFFEDTDLSGPVRLFGSGETSSRIVEIVAADAVIVREVVDEANRPGQWHRSPRRQLEIHLSGTSEIEAGSGETRRFGPGDVLLTEDTHGRGHVFRPIAGPRSMIFVPLADDWELPTDGAEA